MNVTPQIIEKNGKKEFVILPYEEFLAIREALEDYDDLRELREAKKVSSEEESIPLSEIRAELLGE